MFGLNLPAAARGRKQIRLRGNVESFRAVAIKSGGGRLTTDATCIAHASLDAEMAFDARTCAFPAFQSGCRPKTPSGARRGP